MNRKNEASKILVVGGRRIPSVELGAIIPLNEIQKKGLCQFKYIDEVLLSTSEIEWCDILFIVRGASDYTLWATKYAKDKKRIVLGYWDDNLLCIPNYAASYEYYSSRHVYDNITRLFELTDAFFSPNAKLAKEMSLLHGKEVKVLPVVAGVGRLKLPIKKQSSILTIGCAGGPDMEAVLNSLFGKILSNVVAQRKDFKVHIIGSKPDFLGKLSIETIYTPYIDNYYDYQNFASKLEWDIGLAPQMNTEFTTYKFYNKLLEYTNIGCASIFSKIEPYTLVIQDGVNGMLVDNEAVDWTNAILKLLQDSDLRFKIANNAYDYVRDNHSRDVVSEKYIEALSPFLDYRAPKIRRLYPVKMVRKIHYLSNGAISYIRLHGINQFVYRGSLYLFSLLINKIKHLKQLRN